MTDLTTPAGVSRYWLAVPAAGGGARFGADLPKQYSLIAGRTVLQHAFAPFIADRRCAGFVVVISDDDTHWPGVQRKLLEDIAASNSPARRLLSAAGGRQRSDSVCAALQALTAVAAYDDWVMVHDAARPCVSSAEVDALLAAVAAVTAVAPTSAPAAASSVVPSGALLALPIADTIKRGDAALPVSVAATVPRERLWRAQTPQLFRHGELWAALRAAQQAGRTPSDEAQAMEWQGALPLLVEGRASNIKVTRPGDLAIVAALLSGTADAMMSGK